VPSTYEPISTTTLSSAAATITFSSIPNTYTDLRLIFVGKSSVAGNDVNLYFNGDNNGTTYSRTSLLGNGTAASSTRETSAPVIRVSASAAGQSTTIPTFISVDIFSYTNSINKTVLTMWNGDRNGSGYSLPSVGLWRNTAAITSVSFNSASGNFPIGTIATIYGIKAA
jgi:hypothetical protein